MTSSDRVPARAGVGLRLPHIEEAVATRPSAGWFEIHPENFLANPHATELLQELAGQYPISVHTVGLSVGTASGIDRAHLKRVRALIDRIDPVLVSGHLAWSTHGAEYLNDLLPLPFDDETLRIVSAQLREVQDQIGRSYLLENPSSYVGFAGSTMTEVQFLNELVDRTGCRLLCDVSNVYLSAHNMGYDAHAYIDGLPAEAIAELHLGGFTPEDDPATPGGLVLIDTHANEVTSPAWDLYAYALDRFGAKPTLIEWDDDIPAFGTLLGQAAMADAIAAKVLEPEAQRVAAR
ncbi:MAG: DUF692 domain-containing protein, partial [Acidobacteria bacterium]|nr:DUF692 domain-containing protein [Acidobacteriota bacterium]